MKRLSEKRKIWLIRRADKLLARRCRRKLFSQQRLVAPAEMDLDRPETLSFLNQVRLAANNKKKYFGVDFTKIRSITPSCALVFTSEIHRSSLVRGGKNRLRVIDFNKWDSDIKYLLRDMGMFDLLRISNLPKNFMKEPKVSNKRFFKFVSDKTINGEKSVVFRDVVADAISAIPNKKRLQEAISEAMDNALFHGYPDDFVALSPFKQKRWWLSASFDSHNKILSLMFFDQGIGIPKSLPRVHPGLFGKIISLFDDDDKKIEAATRAGRTSTNKVYRGKGLPQIINYVKNYEKSGEVKITSGKGVYKMIKKNESKQAEIKLYLNQFDINGTLIEWQIKL